MQQKLKKSFTLFVRTNSTQPKDIGTYIIFFAKRFVIYEKSISCCTYVF